jgi:hypothetical protein
MDGAGRQHALEYYRRRYPAKSREFSSSVAYSDSFISLPSSFLIVAGIFLNSSVKSAGWQLLGVLVLI